MLSDEEWLQAKIECDRREDEKMERLNKEREKLSNTIGTEEFQIYSEACIRVIARKERRDFKGRLIDSVEEIVPLEVFDWKEAEEFDGEKIALEVYETTLKEIEEKLIELGYEAPFYVWYDLALEGFIFEYGNYYPPSWVLHGKTKGYA